MTPSAPDWRPNRQRLWSNWLWFLALVLSLATLWSAARVIHDQRLRRETLQILAHDRASEIGALGRERFNLLVADAFGPLWKRSGDSLQGLAGLLAYHRARANCRCVDTLPATAFFRYVDTQSFPHDPATRLLTVLPGSPGVAPLADSVVLRIAKSAWDDALVEVKHPVIRLVVDSILGDNAIVTISDPASSRGGTKIYGAVMPASALAATLFKVIPRGRSADTAVSRIVISRLHLDMAAHGHEQHRAHLLELDSLSLGVLSQGRLLYGAAPDDRFTGIAPAPAPIEALSVAVAIRSSQASMAVMMPIAHDRLWLNGVLTLSTLLVIVFAVGSARREVLLARARSDFIAGVSHDLRMPLAQILLASETLTLKRDRDAADRDRLSSSILREARRLNHMVDNVLLFSRSGAVGLQPQLISVVVADLFTEAIESVGLSAEDAEQTVESRAATDIRAIADPGLMRQALVNLIDNAIKYGSRGQRIRLTGIRDGNVVRIAVEDEGPGIPKSERDRLFEAYERLGRDQTSERTGSGLGLAVVKQIVDACRGRVFVDDAPIGTRIIIELPADA